MPEAEDPAAAEPASVAAFWADKPDGKLYAFARPWLHERITVVSEAEADALVDRLVAVAAEQGVGEAMELRASSDEVLVVWVDAETPARIGLNHADSVRDRTLAATVRWP